VYRRSAISSSTHCPNVRSMNGGLGAWAGVAAGGRERPLRVGLSRSLGSNAIDGLAGPRMAQPGGQLPLAPWGFRRPLSDPRADLRLRFHGSERDGRNVPPPD
jgi:hypothetical protein